MSNLPADEYRCTGVNPKREGERCPHPRLPGAILCRQHHLAHLGITTIPPPTPPKQRDISTAPPTKKRGKPKKEKHLSQLEIATTPPPAKKRGRPRRQGSPPLTKDTDDHPTELEITTNVKGKSKPSLPAVKDGQCRRSDGRRWRCQNPRLPSSPYCDRHRQQLAKFHCRRRRSPSPDDDGSRVTSPIALAEAQEKLLPSPGARFRDIRVGEIWALPHESDGLPRSYARVDRIIPGDGLVELTPLVPHPVSLEEMDWVEDGLPLACGLFRAVPPKAVKEVSHLAHQMFVEMLGNGSDKEMKPGSFYKIFPRSGEVWAIYDDCGIKDSGHHFAEIVSGYTEGDGVTVARLADQVEGSDGAALKRQVLEQYELRRNFAVRNDLLWFSHRVPACKVVAEGGEDGGVWEVLMN